MINCISAKLCLSINEIVTHNETLCPLVPGVPMTTFYSAATLDTLLCTQHHHIILYRHGGSLLLYFPLMLCLAPLILRFYPIKEEELIYHPQSECFDLRATAMVTEIFS